MLILIRLSLIILNNYSLGHYLIYKDNKIIINKYWGIDNAESYDCYDEEILDSIQSTIVSSLHLRNRSDVPVGAFLSSGKDSSLVCSYYSKYNNNGIKQHLQ